MLPRAQGASTVSKRAAHTGKNCCEFTGHSSADGRAFLVDHLFPSFIGPSHQIEAVCVARAHKRKSIRLFFVIPVGIVRKKWSIVRRWPYKKDGRRKERKYRASIIIGTGVRACFEPERSPSANHREAAAAAEGSRLVVEVGSDGLISRP